MSFQIVYTPILDVKINHDYFLDDGKKKFNRMNKEKKKKQLANYDVADFLSIVPTPQTKLHLQNHKIILKKIKEGFVLLANVQEYEKAGDNSKVLCPTIQPDKELTFTFEIRFKDPYFDAYTNNSSNKDNCFYYFSNIKPNSETSSFPNFLKVEDSHTRFLLQPKSSREILYDVFSEEIPPIASLGLQKIIAINPRDINDPKNRTVFDTYIAAEKRNGFIGFISLRIDGSGRNDILIDREIKVPEKPNEKRRCLPNKVPNAVLNFENRVMKWKYVQLKTNKEFITKVKHPFTRKGFIELDKNDVVPRLNNVFLSNPSKENVKIEENNIYSKIFI